MKGNNLLNPSTDQGISVRAAFRSPAFRRLLCCAFLILSAVYIGYGLTVPSRCDGFFRWQESVYVLRGVDPFKVASGAVEPHIDIGALRPDGGNMPWTYLLSNFIYPGFLPYHAAFVWARILFCILLCASVLCLDRYVRRTFPAASMPDRLTLIGVFGASYMWFATLRLGNHAAYLCLLLIILFTFDHNRHWVLAGILYGFLLMKPQTTALFLLFFLLDRQFKPVLLAAGMLGIVTLVTGYLIDCNPLEMVKNAYTLCVSYEDLTVYIYYGLLDPLVSVFHAPSSAILPIGMGLGVVAVLMLKYRIRSESRAVNFAALSLLTVCWMYIQPSDMIILGFVGFACLLVLLSCKQNRRVSAFIGLGAVFGALPVIGRVYMASPLIPLAVRLFYFAVVWSLIREDRKACGIVPPAAEQAPV